MFTGTYTAIATPFKSGAIDAAALERLIKAQIRGGVDGIVPVGTTGESPTVNYEEHVEIIAQSVKFAAGKIKVLAGTGGNSTSEAVYLTQHAEKEGADGSLQVAPYYNNFAKWRAKPGCPSCSTASRAAAASRSPSKPSSAWQRNAKISSGSKKP